MRPWFADIGRHGVAIAAAAAAIGATWLVRNRTVKPQPPDLGDIPVYEEAATSTRDQPPYLVADLDGDGVDELVLRVEDPRGAEMVVLARQGGVYVPIGRVPLQTGLAPCASTFTLEDGSLMVTDYEQASWSEGGCRPQRHVLYGMSDGQLVAQATMIDL